MSNHRNIEQSPFHAGERYVQTQVGVRDIENWARKVVRPYLPEQHRGFHTALPFLVAAARDGYGRPWATLLSGPDGFVTSPDSRTLNIHARPAAGDALEDAFVGGADIGILGIELATRRRNRVNGRVARDGVGGLVLAVEQAFGNCPQYIREREWRRVDGGTPGKPRRGKKLTASQQTWIAEADTFFIASGYRGDGESPVFGMDASHRGGDPGFVVVEDPGRIVFPDYAGNNHFNTIGNLVLDPRAGMLFVDFHSGSLLQLTGRTTIDWGSEALSRFPAARRLVTLEIDEVVELPSALNLRWNADAESVRSLRLVEKVCESDDVTSFIFEARDGGSLPDFEAGQHLPIELEVPGHSVPVRRTYSLSGDPRSNRYRISVKREPGGLVSNHLHDQLEPGAILQARTPAGEFLLPPADSPVVLVSAGVGVTPMVSMLYALTAEKDERPVWFVHAARDGNHHPLAQEVRQIAAKRPDVNVQVAYSRPRPEDLQKRAYDLEGRIDADLLVRIVQNPDAHYLLCGPSRFMGDIQTGLEEMGVPLSQIRTEKFGPSG